MKNKLLFLTLLVFQFTFSQNIPPEISSDGSQIYCPLSFQSIVTGFNIIDPDDSSIDALYIQISEGYVEGEDFLTLAGEHPGVQETWNAIEGKL